MDAGIRDVRPKLPQDVLELSLVLVQGGILGSTESGQSRDDGGGGDTHGEELRFLNASDVSRWFHNMLAVASSRVASYIHVPWEALGYGFEEKRSILGWKSADN